MSYFRRSVASPVRYILSRLQQGEPPGYKGTKEFEHLSDGIGRMIGALQEKTRYLEGILENMSGGVAVFDGDLRLRAWNEHFVSLNRYPHDLVHLGEPYADIIRYSAQRGDYGSGDPDAQLAERVRRAEIFEPIQQEIHRADGTWVELRRSPMPEGGFVTTYNDISERKHTEAELARHRENLEELVALRTDELVRSNQRLEDARVRLHDAIESSPGAFSLFDSHDRLAVFNSRYARLYPGLEPLVVPGSTFESIIRAAVEHGIPLDANDEPEAWLADRLYRHREPGDSLIRRRNDGRWLQIDERKTEEGGIVAWYTDITDRKRAEEKLRELNQLKDRYLGMAAHDLRNLERSPCGARSEAQIAIRS